MRRIEGLQQPLALEGIHARIACQQHGERRGLHRSVSVHIGVRGAGTHTTEAVQRQHSERKGATLGAGQVAPVHQADLQVVLLAEVVAVIRAVQLEIVAAAAAAVVLTVVVPLTCYVPIDNRGRR
ncbi:hypothetical protein G6F61_014476 [Rhizopus arrhizus]|nr:hypothetical protein G6F61_014476 [Rhizopus arrhizus]